MFLGYEGSLLNFIDVKTGKKQKQSIIFFIVVIIEYSMWQTLSVQHPTKVS